MAIRIERVLGIATPVTSPRTSGRIFGLPVGGPADPFSSEIANTLVGNALNFQTFELAQAALEFTVESDTAMAVVGGRCTVSIDSTTHEGNQSFRLLEGQRVGISPSLIGNYVYLALAGAAQIPYGADLRGTTVECGRDRLRSIRLAEPPTSLEFGVVRYLASEQFTPDLPDEFEVDRVSNRVGVRLTPALAPHGFELPSEPATVGAIQWTPGGQLIVIGPDGPTIGGYPKVGYVFSSDLPRLLQIPAGGRVTFQRGNADGAAAARLASAGRQQALLRLLRLHLGEA